jgi:hypothetical protein
MLKKPGGVGSGLFEKYNHFLACGVIMKSFFFIKHCFRQIRFFSIITLLLILAPSTLWAQSTEPSSNQATEEPAAATPAALINLISPVEGSMVIGKKPEIKFSLVDPGAIQGIVVLLDGTDITNVLKQDGEVFSFKPLAALASGQHALQIAAKSNDGQELIQELAFSSRHTEKFEEAVSENDLGLVYKRRLAKSDQITNEVEDRFDANLSSKSKLKEGNFETSFTTNLRYMDQDLPIAEPERKGINLANFLWQTKYTKDKFSTGSDVGDLQINETPLTVQGLSRRGGQLAVGYGNYEAHGFVVRSKELFGFNGGLGIEGPTNEHILGASASAKFWQEKVLLKGTYITGGERENSYGTWGNVSQKRGNVSSVALQIKMFDEKLLFDSEYADSSLDGDTTDDYGAEEDKAFNFGFSGVYNIFSWKAAYQYVGPRYYVIGNPSLPNDFAGINLEGTASFSVQTITLGFSQSHDNVKNDPLAPQVTTTAGKAAYTYSGIENLTLGLNYDPSWLKSSDEPSGTDPVDSRKDAYSANIGYKIGKWDLQFQTSHTLENDRTATDNDTKTTTYTLTPVLTLETLTVTPSYSFNTSWAKGTDVTTDTYTTGLNFSGSFFDKSLCYDFAGTHNRTKASDLSTDNYTLTATYKVAYVLAKEFLGFVNPSLGIEGRYGSTYDYLTDTSSHEKLVFLVFSTNLPFSF